ncbi:hypothetical protein WA026_013065 [Henosepilachna vigintioctopunctata]|uniref:CBF1-interacting co-repressor CIR N-terminal domain-containing protein n=1 Tax=Henosepilachna vigintioctopunctata TaxID=420089 RepID=A0AAW1UKY4_9CUCU
MNILPKKRWHVRNKDNIARVRKDEAKALEEKNEREYRQKLAEREARTNLLRKNAKLRVGGETFIPFKEKDVGESGGHINFFQEIEDSREESNRTNKEYEKEKKEEKEKYEKQIGYLTYLGQDTNEALKKKNWYDEIPERDGSHLAEVGLKSKLKDDPLEVVKKYLPTKHSPNISFTQSDEIRYKEGKFNNSLLKTKDKRKDKKKSKKKVKNDEVSVDYDSEKKKKLEILRKERIQREMKERQKSDLLLAQLNNKSNVTEISNTVKRRYNSQFNPELSRQNF